MPIKLIHLDLRTKIATLECGCGGRMLLPTTAPPRTSPRTFAVRCAGRSWRTRTTWRS